MVLLILCAIYIRFISDFIFILTAEYNSAHNVMMAEEGAKLIQDRDIIDLVKENILQDKKREVEYTNLMQDYISFLKDEVIH